MQYPLKLTRSYISKSQTQHRYSPRVISLSHNETTNLRQSSFRALNYLNNCFSLKPHILLYQLSNTLVVKTNQEPKGQLPWRWSFMHLIGLQHLEVSCLKVKKIQFIHDVSESVQGSYLPWQIQVILRRGD